MVAQAQVPALSAHRPGPGGGFNTPTVVVPKGTLGKW